MRKQHQKGRSAHLYFQYKLLIVIVLCPKKHELLVRKQHQKGRRPKKRNKMAGGNLPSRDSFSSKFGIIAAAAGSAIGLGNIWRFPYIAGENGGGAFLILYLAFIFVIGIPVMMSELTIGRRAQLNAFGSFKKLAPGKPWYLVGFMGVIAAFMILAFYSTIAGWTLQYLYLSITDAFSGKTQVELTQVYDTFLASSYMPSIWQLIFMLLTGWIVMAGVKNGIEKYTKILMPLLLVIIIILDIRALTLPNSMDGLTFLFKPDFSKITADVVLEALGQAFFSLSIGMGTLITYGSYIRKDNNLGSTAISVSLADTFIAILSGVAIFPAVFAFGIQPDAGTGLVFIVLPNLFSQMTGGYIFALLFFLLLSVAALTSTISVLEVVVAYFSEELKMSRKKATVLASVSIAFIGVFATLSLGPLKDYTLFDKNFFEILDFTSANIMLPLGGLLIVVFVGWYLGKDKVSDELSNQGALKLPLMGIFMFIIKFIAPIAIAIVFMNGIGLLNL